MRKAYNAPPGFYLEGVTFKIEFAIKKNMDGGVLFIGPELEDLKAQNVVIHHQSIHMKITN